MSSDGGVDLDCLTRICEYGDKEQAHFEGS